MALDPAAPFTPPPRTAPREHRKKAAAQSATAAAAKAAGKVPAQPTLVSLIGAAGLAAAGSHGAGVGGKGEFAEPSADAAAIVSGPPGFAQVLSVVATLQSRLQESEATVQDLQASLDQAEERRRHWARRAERAELERDTARRRTDEQQAVAKAARKEAMPLVERYMEAEVLRTQMQALESELERHRQEMASTCAELEQGWPRLTDAEDAEAECSEAIAILEATFAEEAAVLRSVHLEEMSDSRARHASRIAEIESARQEEVAVLKIANAEELGSLKTALDNAEWQADVYVREQQDSVREACLRQRENARLAKRRVESQQEVVELQVKLEAIRAATAGAPAREAEMQAIQKREKLYQRTIAEWREALERKEEDCKTWRRRAVQRGANIDGDEDAEDLDESAIPATPAPSAPSHIGHGPTGKARPARHNEVPVLDVSNPSTPGQLTPVPPASPSVASCGGGSVDVSAMGRQQQHQQEAGSGLHIGPPTRTSPPPPHHGRPVSASSWPSVPTPARTSNRASGQQKSRSQHQKPPSRHAQLQQQEQPRSRQHAAGILQLPLPFAEPSTPLPAERIEDVTDFPQLILPPPQPADEFLAVAVRTARLQSQADVADSRGGGLSSRSGGTIGKEGEAEYETDVGARLDGAVREAENQLQILTFLLDESDAREAEHLLELEARRQPPAVAARLRAHLAELAPRGRARNDARSLSSPTSPEVNLLMVR